MPLFRMLPFLVALIFFTGRAHAVTFTFVDNKECPTKQTSRFCHIYFKKLISWNPSYKDLVTKSWPNDYTGRFAKMDAMLRNANIDNVRLALLTENQATAETYYSFDNKSVYILLYPSFFETSVIYDNGVSERTHVLIHELVHSLSRLTTDDPSTTSPFWRSLGQTMAWQDLMRINSLIDPRERSIIATARSRLVKEGKISEALHIELDYSRRAGFPSTYSMINMREFFAELISFLVHDPEMEKALTADLHNWLLSNGYGELLQQKKMIGQDPYIANPLPELSFEFVGLMYVNNRPRCTVSVIRHGLILSAKHCLADSLDLLLKGGKFPFLKMEFPYSQENLMIFGMSIYSVTQDSVDNDFIYLHYDPILSINRLKIPEIQTMNSKESLDKEAKLLLAAFRLPQKARELKMEIQMCSATNEIGSINAILPQYTGILRGSTCQAYFMSSGAPFFQINEKKELVLVGVLAHTFSLDEHGQLDSSQISNDGWGDKTFTNFSPLSEVRNWPPLRVLSHF